LKNPDLKILVSEEAEFDIDDAYIWYELQKKDLGAAFIKNINSGFNKIKRNPYLYPIIHLSVRKHLIKKFPFCVYYFIDDSDNTIKIVAVVHNSRNPNIWKFRV
jgi:plasmid stabilization system protein ParE